VQRVEQRQFRPELGVQVAESRAARLRYVERLKGSPSVDPASGGARSEGLPDELRAPLERMRRRVVAAANVKSRSSPTPGGCASAIDADVESDADRLPSQG
jgi:hypothetical protein